MTVETLIKHLEKQGKNQEVRLHDVHGEPVIFVLSAKNKDGVWLETETDTDMADEIQTRFDDAIENGTDELDVYMVRKYLGTDAADHMQTFCEEHGLI